MPCQEPPRKLRQFITVAALLLSALLPFASLQAACTSSYFEKAYLNEYFFGTALNYLEVYIPNNNKVLPAEWETWTVRVFTGSGPSDFIDYPLTTTNPNTHACDFGSKTFITHEVPAGLPGTGAAVNAVLLDGSNNEVDYLKFDNKTPIAEYISPQCSYPATHDIDLLIANYGNKDAARFPDGKGDWSISSLTGANTTYTRCSSNDATISKTVSAATIPVSAVANSAYFFTISVTNPGNQGLSAVTVTDSWPAELTYDSHTASTGSYDATSGVWNIGTMAKNSTATLTLYFHGTTVGSFTNTANLSYSGITYPAADSAIANIVPALDHLRLLHSGSGLTCTPSSVTLQACADAACTTLYTDSISVTLSPTGWEGGDTVTFSGGTVTKNLWHTTAETITLGATSNPAANSASRCFIGATESCSHTFAASGFTFAVPTQTSARLSAPVTLSAVKADPADPKSCAPAFTGTRSVNFWSSYLSPSPYSGSPALKVNGSDVSGTAPGTPISLTFDANAQSTFTVQFPDAGKLQLDARYSSSSGGDTGLVMSGASQFVVKPAGYCVMSPDTNADCASGDATCSAFKPASAPFNLTVKAVAWESDTDTDLCNGNATTPNFKLNAIPLIHTLVSPAGGVSGSLGVNAVDISSNGTATLSNQSISEVGVFTLTAPSSAYLDGVMTAAGTSAYIGRFYADTFSVGLTPAAFAPANGSFTYLGQPFSYVAAPNLLISALSATGTLLQNYQGAYWKLGTQIDVTSDITGCTGNCFHYSDNVGGTPSLTAPATAIGFGNTTSVAGSLTLIGIHDTGSFSYSKPVTPVAPFDADLKLAVSLRDGDGATGGASLNNIGFYNDSDSAPFATTNDRLLRYGRATLADTTAAGTSSGTAAYVPLAVQYFDGSAFVANSDDTTTAIAHSSAVPAFACSDPDTSGDTLSCPTVTIPDATVTNDNRFLFALNADINPGGGTLLYALQNSVVPAYLQYDWDGDGILEATDQASASVTFAPPSYYHGDHRFIYWREQNR